ncbi:MAG: LysE family transporter [Halobacteria archaeon]|nr:LysE family transporter [Halobacteria archaeon]
MLSTIAGSLVSGVLLGLSLAAPPGPMNAVIAEETALGSLRDGFRAGLGALTADTVFCVLSVAGLLAVVGSRTRTLLYALGGLLMLYFGYSAVSDIRSGDTFGFRADADTHAEDGGRRGFTKAFVLALTNPYQIAWWLTAGVTLVESRPVALVGFFVGILVWITVFPTGLSLGSERFDGGFARGVTYLSGGILTAFGVFFIYTAASRSVF